MINSRLSVAIHILCLIADNPNQQLSSEYIAGSVNTNPVVIRRISSSLRKAGLLSSQVGVPGAQLTKNPADISLLDIYHAVQTHDELFSIHERPNPKCPVGSRIQTTLDSTFARVQKAMEDELARQSLEEVMQHLFT